MSVARFKRLQALEREEGRDRITVRRTLVTRGEHGELVRTPHVSYTLEHGVKTVLKAGHEGGPL